ncbi:MAG: DJ-1/PfpI family protein [Chitinophagaceae bacterium]|nr:DJ-1/PfpI family protein [Chitinophagaceae bacterium]
MKIAFIIFDGITWLDLIGVYDPISRLKTLNYLPELRWEFCSYTESAKDSFGLTMLSTKVRESLQDYDVIIVPGGWGTRRLQYDEPFITWLKTAAAVKYKISVCTGSLLLGAAGFLKNKSATTHFQEYEALKPYCRQVVHHRIVEDENVITAGAVASSLDLGLYLCEKWAGENAKKTIEEKMNYNSLL